MNQLYYNKIGYNEPYKLLEVLIRNKSYDIKSQKFLSDLSDEIMSTSDLEIFNKFISHHFESPKKVLLTDKEVIFFAQIYPDKILKQASNTLPRNIPELGKCCSEKETYVIFKSILHYVNYSYSNFDFDQKIEKSKYPDFNIKTEMGIKFQGLLYTQLTDLFTVFRNNNIYQIDKGFVINISSYFDPIDWNIIQNYAKRMMTFPNIINLSEKELYFYNSLFIGILTRLKDTNKYCIFNSLEHLKNTGFYYKCDFIDPREKEEYKLMYFY